MRTVELPYVDFKNETEARNRISAWAVENLLEISEPTTLRSYPGCVHWHITQTGKSGVLELTWWPGGRRFWFKVAANRKAEWIDDLLGSSEPKF